MNMDDLRIGDQFLDKRVKLLDCQREMVHYWYERGLSQRKLAAMFKVSRRLIQFVLDDEKLKENLKRREERGGTAQYYDKEKHKNYARNHRAYKREVYERHSRDG